MQENDQARGLAEILKAQPPATLPSAAERAGAVVIEFTAQHQLPPEAEARLRSLIQAAISERYDELVDTRVGRVFGAALAHL